MISTNYYFIGQTDFFCGKIRDVYTIGNDVLVMIVTDRISAFDIVFPYTIPYKGQILNQIASKFLDATVDIIPNWKLAMPDPMVTVGLKCEPFKIEMIIRGYLAGSAWREYKSGRRSICSVVLPEGLRENEKFKTPIITPTTKTNKGHDENISKEKIIDCGLVSKDEYEQLEYYTLALFKRGSDIAISKGLILVDTKYEFGKRDGKIYLIDEIHTPDSSRYFYAGNYQELFEKGENQKQLSKEFVRQWLVEQGFQGKDCQPIPNMTHEYCQSISQRYIELYEIITGEKFIKSDIHNVSDRIEKNIKDFLDKNKLM
ncbi:MAG: phosphoribosylaminoimidazolesuccinocarboxamide synthase [Bacteroidales bacterium OttesenSCG-928-I14]|jgi:phosphoribosylaminoimidazole-succinocarboxamide synthase|nr:phosphoribosylaminoimidazolesuccinocarboxamide synthase [Bacteroidales bacterium OttesenSCG-928-I14]